MITPEPSAGQSRLRLENLLPKSYRVLLRKRPTAGATALLRDVRHDWSHRRSTRSGF